MPRIRGIRIFPLWFSYVDDVEARSIALLFTHTHTHTLTHTFVRLDSHKSLDTHQIQNIGNQIFSDDRSEISDQLGLLWCIFVVLLLTFVFPVSNMAFLMYTSTKSLTVHQQKICYVVAEILNIWACLDVLIMTAVVAMSPLSMVFELVQLPMCVTDYKPFLDRTVVPLGIMNEEDTWCYYVYAIFGYGTVICLFTATVNMFVAQFVLRLLEVSISNRESRFKMIDADYSHTRDLTHTRRCGHELLTLLNRFILYCISIKGYDAKMSHSNSCRATVVKVQDSGSSSVKDDSDLFGIGNVASPLAIATTTQHEDPEKDPMRAMSL